MSVISVFRFISKPPPTNSIRIKNTSTLHPTRNTFSVFKLKQIKSTKNEFRKFKFMKKKKINRNNNKMLGVYLC